MFSFQQRTDGWSRKLPVSNSCLCRVLAGVNSGSQLFEITYHLVFLMLECTPLVSEERNLLKMYLRLI